MAAPVTLSTSAWTEVASAGFKKAIVKAGKYGVWCELASSTPSSGSTQLGILVGGRETQVVETGSATLALYGRCADSGATIQVMTTGAPAVVQSDSAALNAAEVTFTETDGAGVYTGSINVPAGASLHDILINGVALWDNAGACTLKVGDVADDDGFFTAVNLKATDLLAGESISFDNAGGKAGAYIANSQVSPRYSATARVISGIITTASTGGSAGRTRMTVLYTAPVAGAITAATKV